jgi:lipopolysaccharide transport system ATP-binding protein
LKDINFEIKEGDRVGIVGRNGAGKSTLLKVLSRITEPTDGRIHIRGRIASLLEVGTGFHPELTGRENIFLNGAILGMGRAEIRRKFDEIVEFSGVEKFLDTPVKRYSSGMYVRLAFAVAAHLESEIMVIDEVLAVGDAEFQKKCLGKMEDVSKSGRTILFVSHNMGAVETLCNKGIFINKGQLIASGGSKEIIDLYMSDSLKNLNLRNGIVDGQSRGDEKIIKRVELYADGAITDSIPMGSEFSIKVYFNSIQPLSYPVLGVILKDPFNTPLLGINNKNYSGNVSESSVGEGVISMTIPYLQLMSGNYSFDIHLGDGHLDIDVWKDVCSFRVEQMKFADGDFPNESLNKFFIPDIQWNVEQVNHTLI